MSKIAILTDSSCDIPQELAEKYGIDIMGFHILLDDEDIVEREKYTPEEFYNKMRNRYQMRCSRAPGNQKMRDDYNAWRKQAQIALSKYQLGEISWEEFEKIIRDNL